MILTLLGISTLTISEQLKNAFLEILVTPSGITTSESLPVYFMRQSSLISKSRRGIDVATLDFAASFFSDSVFFEDSFFFTGALGTVGATFGEVFA